jgi:hypothetical protein
LCLNKAAVNKCLDENCTFPNKQTKKYFFICTKGAAVCTVCNENISVLKEYSIKRYYETKHGSQLSQTGPAKKRQNNSASKPSCSTTPEVIQKLGLPIRRSTLLAKKQWQASQQRTS